MAETDPTERALLLLSLLQTHRFWPGAELTDRLGVSARTLRRDVDRLRVARLPGRRDARGRPAATAWPPARTSRRCCSTTTKRSPSRSGCGPRRARRSTASRTPRSRALAKLEQVLPDRLRRRVHAVHSQRRVAAVGRRADGRRRRARGARARVPRPRAGALRLPPSRRRRLQPAGRAPPARVDRAPVVPRGVGRPPRRLAHVPARPPRAARASRACGARPATSPVATRPRSSPSRSARCRCPYSALLEVGGAADAVRAALRWSDAEVEELGADRSRVRVGSGSDRGAACASSPWLAGSYPVVVARARRARGTRRSSWWRAVCGA